MTTRRLTVYGHRGAPAEVPENTIASFARALEVGADALETDCHMTRDGVLVLAHDETGARTAGVSDRIRAEPWSRVRRWDVGRGLHPPALDEVLDAFPEVRINVDAKQEEPNIIPALLRLLRAKDACARVRIASFSQKNLERVRRAGYEGDTALGPAEVARLYLAPSWAPLRLGQAAQIPVRQGPFDLSTPAFIAKCKQRGIRLDYWTIDDPAQARALFERGADGVITNDPRAIVPVARSLER